MDGMAPLFYGVDKYCLEQVPAGSKMIARYFELKDEKIEATIFYRTENGDGPKRRIDVEWSLTNIGDVGATEAVPFRNPN